MKVLSQEEIDALHKKYAPAETAYSLVHEHCEIVWRIAEQLIQVNNLLVDKDLVRMGCLLHDVGVYEYFDAHGSFNHAIDYTEHAVRGQKMLEIEHLPPELSRLVSHHIGVGLTADDIRKQKIPIPIQDYTPQTKEERLVAYADKFHSKTYPRPQFNSFDWYKNFCARFGAAQPQKFIAMSKEFGIPELQALASEYGYDIRSQQGV